MQPWPEACRITGWEIKLDTLDRERHPGGFAHLQHAHRLSCSLFSPICNMRLFLCAPRERERERERCLFEWPKCFLQAQTGPGTCTPHTHTHTHTHENNRTDVHREALFSSRVPHFLDWTRPTRHIIVKCGSGAFWMPKDSLRIQFKHTHTWRYS